MAEQVSIVVNTQIRSIPLIIYRRIVLQLERVGLCCLPNTTLLNHPYQLLITPGTTSFR